MDVLLTQVELVSFVHPQLEGPTSEDVVRLVDQEYAKACSRSWRQKPRRPQG